MSTDGNKTGGIKRRRVRRAHVPTPESREKVRMLKLVGATDEQVGRILGMSVDCLVEHYRQDLDDGKAEVLGKVAQTLYQKALEGDVTSCIFILKTKAKWSEKIEIDRLDQPGTLVIHTSGKTIDDYTDEEFVAIMEEGRDRPCLMPGKEGENRK